MKSLFKNKLFAALAIIGLSTAFASAATFSISTNIAVNRTIRLIDGPASINSIAMQNAITTNSIVAFYVAPGTNTYFTNGVYTNYTWAATTYTNWYTNFFGELYTNTFSAVQRTTNSVAAGTNFYPTLWAATAVSNATTTYLPPFPVTAPLGLVITNGLSPITVTITYDQ